MNSGKQKPAKTDATIAKNRKARFNYHIEDDFEAGLCLEGWEVKSLRAGNANLTESYAFIKNGEAWLTGCHITPLGTASTHINPEPRRARKLLLNRHELDRLTGAIERKGYTLVPLKLYWSKGRAKLRLGLAKGKQQHDKRADSKDRDWKRQQARILKSSR
jgi:SsrA-binding protein